MINYLDFVSESCAQKPVYTAPLTSMLQILSDPIIKQSAVLSK